MDWFLIYQLYVGYKFIDILVLEPPGTDSRLNIDLIFYLIIGHVLLIIDMILIADWSDIKELLIFLDNSFDLDLFVPDLVVYIYY